MSTIESILIEADQLGIREEVINYSIEIREVNPKLNREESMEVALGLIKQALGNE